MSPTTQQIETQNLEVGSSRKQEASENSENEISTQKKDIPTTEVCDEKAKDQ